MVGLKADNLNARKPHFLCHFAEYIELLGALGHFDTGTFESAHKFMTVSVWERTSKQ
jgi:hypothetical protein